MPLQSCFLTRAALATHTFTLNARQNRCPSFGTTNIGSKVRDLRVAHVYEKVGPATKEYCRVMLRSIEERKRKSRLPPVDLISSGVTSQTLHSQLGDTISEVYSDASFRESPTPHLGTYPIPECSVVHSRSFPVAPPSSPLY